MSPRSAREGEPGLSTGKRRRIRPTHKWELLLPLFEWPEQARYEKIRPLVLFDAPTARRRRLPPAMRRLIVGLKAEHPAFNLNEIANVVRAAFARKPDVRSVKRVLDETPLPLKIVRNYPPFHETGLVGKEADLWLLEDTLTVEHAGEPLSAYEVAYDSAGGKGGAGRLLRVGKPTLFETPFAPDQMRLFRLAETLGEDGWLKALRLKDYAPRSPRRPTMPQQVLFTHTEAI